MSELSPTPTQAPESPDPARLMAELDETLSDAVRRASSRAEHIRLTRIQALVYALHGAPAT